MRWSSVPVVLAVVVALGTNAAGLYVYLPDVLVIETSEEADDWLSEMEVSMGIQASEDPEAADRPDLNRLNRLTRVMERHWASLDADCDPNAVFALMYLVTTYGVEAHIEEEYFDDNEYLSVITVLFAQLYLEAYENWEDGNTDDVPLAWLEAFEWASSGNSDILEDEFLGMNAHINYDLAVALATLGTTDPDTGESRKAEMDRINHVLADVTDDVQYWIAYYYGPEEPTEPPSSEHTTPFTAPDAVLVLEPVYEWREEAWNNAIIIEEAPDEASRQAHDDYMQTRSWTIAQGFQTPKAQDPSPARLAYCQSHG